MSLEAVLEANTLAMRELTAALIAAGAITTAQAPGVDKVVKAQKAVTENVTKKPDTPVTKSGEPSTAARVIESAEENPDGTLIDKEPAAVVTMKPWHEKTAALFAELNGKEPVLAHVQKAVLGINTHCGREQATALLSRFGAQAISPKPDKKGLDAAQYPDVFALALEVLAGRVDATESMVSE